MDGEGNRLLERIDSVAGVMQPYTYSATGAPVQRGRLRYEYDAKDQLSALYRDERLLARYAYNGFGERIRKVVYSQGKRPTVTYYLYSNSTLVAEADESGRITAQYQYLEDHRPVLMLQGKQAYVIHTDHLGTPRVVSDEQGSIRWQASYTPFGKAIITQADIDLRLRFPGQYADAESGTHYNYLRDYDPQLGRYLRSDPIGLGGGLNTYAYVAGNPLGAIDPLGLFQLPSAGSPLWNFIQQNNLQNQAYLANTPASQPVPPPRVGVPATTVLRGLARANALFKIAEVAYTVGYQGAALADALFTQIDHDDMVAQIQRYIPGYVARGEAAQVSAEGIMALGNDLYAAQLDLIAQSDSACVVDQLLFDAQWAVGGGAQISNEIKAQIREQYEQQYLSYQANGGTGSFEDWLAEGMPEDDYDYAGCSGLLGNVAIPRCAPGHGRWSEPSSPGNSIWISASGTPRHEALKAYGVEGINFSNGHPEFEPFAFPEPGVPGTKAIVEVHGMKGNTTSDFIAADQAYRDLIGDQSWERDTNIWTWHHHQDCVTMVLVPRNIHAGLRHQGGASAIRNGTCT